MKPIKIAIAAAFVALFSQVAQASFKTNDLYLGFNSPGAQGDYIIDLGNATSALGLGGTKVVDLSNLISLTTFNSVFTSGKAGVTVAVVGGNNLVLKNAIYATQARAGGAGNAAVAGSDLTQQTHSVGVLAGAISGLTGAPWPTAGGSMVDATKSYTTLVGPELVSGNFYSKSGVMPFGTFDSSGVVYLDLWYATVPLAYTYQGYFTIDLSGATALLTFTPKDASTSAPVPPALTSLSPVSGSTNGGTVVTLTGSNFLSGATVQFGGSSAAAVTVNSATQITATTPAHAPGLVNVIVSNTNALSTTNLSAFNFVLPPPPATLGGSALLLDGNLGMVWIGGTNKSCVLLSGTNVNQPLSTWMPVATNIVAADGLSTNVIPVNAGEPQRWYLLSTPYN